MRHLTIFLLSLCAGLTLAQSKFDLGVTITKTGVDPVVSGRMLELRHFLGTKATAEAHAFFGATTMDGAFFGGAALAFPVKVSETATGLIGLYGRFVASRPVGGGFFLGVRLR